MIPASLAALSMPFSLPLVLNVPNQMVLLASPHFEPRGLPVAATGEEIVAQLPNNAQIATAANALNVRFMIKKN